MAGGVSEQATELRKYPVGLLIAYVFDFLKSNEDVVLELFDIHLIAQIQAEQIRRYFISGGEKNKSSSSGFFMH